MRCSVNSISACGKTDTGLKRRRNEDSYAVELDYGLFIVADGMGGHAAGDMASSMAVNIVGDFIKKALSDSEMTWPFGLDRSVPIEINAISSGIRLANRYIFNDSKDMGTTMVVLLVKGDKAAICHVGDSRLYRIRYNTIEQITEDHSLAADAIKKGTITKEEARNYYLRHVVTMAIGMNADIRCDCRVEIVRSEDMFLLCSDGLSSMLEDSEILSITTKENSIEQGCEKLVRMANEKGGDDNITAILVRCK
jgi:serine/threonine protein phosphatase PrpC